MKRIVIVGGLIVGAHLAHGFRLPVASDTATEAPPSVVVKVGNIYRQSADISVYNTSGKRLTSVFLHCTFRDAGGQRIDSVPVLVSDLAMNDMASERARTPKHADIAKVDCLTDHAL